jgi:hypothetical protein
LRASRIANAALSGIKGSLRVALIGVVQLG